MLLVAICFIGSSKEGLELLFYTSYAVVGVDCWNCCYCFLKGGFWYLLVELLLSECLLLWCLLLLLGSRTIPPVRMISPTRILGIEVSIILLLLRSEWLSKLHGKNINNLLYFLECETCIC